MSLKKSLIYALLLVLPGITGVAAQNEFPAKGGVSPAVTIVAFADFQCPYCTKADATMNELLAAYGDKVQLVFRNMPLAFHPEALHAAVAGYCAFQQGKFWQMHDQLVKNTDQLSSDLYTSLASKLGLDSRKFQSCQSSQAAQDAIATDLADAASLQIQAVPSFLLISKDRSIKLAGALPLSEFQAKIDDLLSNPANNP